jgi:hypothetical protein
MNARFCKQLSLKSGGLTVVRGPCNWVAGNVSAVI